MLMLGTILIEEIQYSLKQWRLIQSLSLTFFLSLQIAHLVWSFLGFIFNYMFYLVPVLKYCLFKKI